MSFAAAVAKMDAQADNRLGDSLFYHRGGLISTEPVKGFITDPAELALAGLDASLETNTGRRRRLEISRQIVDKPTRGDRIESDHPLLAGATWMPSNWLAYRGGRYWLMDLKVTGQ